MKCPRCRFETPSDAEFCPECGAKLVLACAQCGTANAPGHKFCKKCGRPLASAAQTPIGTRFAAPQAYTPKHLAKKILTSRSALEGERKQVTVLFADLKGSMELLADRDPEEARKLLDPVLERMMEAVHRYEGTVNQVMGDGIMALFGAPLAHEDHAVRACYAALAMQSAIRRYTEEVRRAHGIEVQIRVGLNSGEVVVRAIGNDLHMDYTAVGQTTHLAARMEQLATPGSIRLTAETLRLAEGFVQVTALGTVPVKGLPDAVEVFELVGAAATRTRMQAALARGLTRFVGRDVELEALRQALERARGGHGQVVALVGEPGVGKSRLFWEFTHSHRTQGWLLLESGSVSYGKATPYLPVIDLLKAYFQVDVRDDARKIQEKVTGKLLTLERALEPTLPAFLALLDVPPEDPQWERLDPPQRRQRTLDGVKRLLLRESQVQPLLVMFEDLHWIDAETQALLDSLVESLPTARLLLLVNYRPEYQHGWGSKTYYRQLRIDPLPPENAEELLEALLGNDASLPPLKRLLIERTEGNPFFLEESLRTLVETRLLVGERGAYRLAQDLVSIQMPATVQAVLAARIDRLPPEEKRLLQSAAVIGHDVAFVLLQAIAELPEEEFRQCLAHLQAAEFLYEAKLFPELEYTFKHALTHEVAYGSLLQDRRRTLHARIGVAIEELYPDRLEERAEELARHFQRGEVWDKAARYARQAADRATALCADAKAVESYEDELEAISQLPVTPETVRQAIDVRLALRAPLWRAGRLDHLFEIFQEAEVLATQHDATERLDSVYSFFVQYYWAKGQHAQAVAYGQRCLDASRRRDDLGLAVTGHYYSGWAHLSSGQFRQAIEHFTRIIERLEGPHETERFGLSGLPYCSACALAAQCLIAQGDHAQALQFIQRGERVAHAANHLYSKMPLAIARGRALLTQGLATEAMAVLEPVIATCREKKFAGQLMHALTFLAHAYVLAGRPADAIPPAQEAVELHEKANAFADHAMMLGALAEGHLRAGHLEAAESVVHDALRYATRHAERGYEGWNRWLLGELASERRNVGMATHALGEAMSIARELGMRPLLAHCYLSLGTLYRRTGKRAQGQEHLTTAMAMYREMEMRFWLEQTEAALKELG